MELLPQMRAVTDFFGQEKMQNICQASIKSRTNMLKPFVRARRALGLSLSWERQQQSRPSFLSTQLTEADRIKFPMTWVKRHDEYTADEKDHALTDAKADLAIKEVLAEHSQRSGPQRHNTLVLNFSISPNLLLLLFSVSVAALFILCL